MIKHILYVLILRLLVLSTSVQGLERDSLLINLTHIKSDYLHAEDTTAFAMKEIRQPAIISSRSTPASYSSYDVGKIPIEEGITPTGGRTYTLPIAVCEAEGFFPKVALSYNSQAGNGIAGYGWNITGLPCISLSHKSRWYHGKVAPASALDIAAVYTLDGNNIAKTIDYKGIDDYGGIDKYIVSKEYMAEQYYVHEYGHTIQGKKWGPLYLPVPALLSLWNCRNNAIVPHRRFWVEKWANTYSKWYFGTKRVKERYPDYIFPSTLLTY